MSSSRFRASACLLLLLAVLPVLASTTGSSAAAPRGSLSVSPGQYVGGQRLTFEGNIGARGKRKVKLQLNLSRPGDPWNDVNGFRKRWTRADGSFRFGYTAPAMFGIRMRVASGRLHTPPITFHAASQDLVVRTSRVSGLGENQVVAGRPFDVLVDTTPESRTDLARRTDLPPPAFPGRALTFQQRNPDGTWQTLATSTTDQQGNGVFRGVVVDQPGTVVYRVRQEDWTQGGDRIGWYPSFPTYVMVRNPGAVDRAVADPEPAARATEEPGVPLTLGRDVASRTAAETYKWRPSLFDFGWTYGESLTTRPSRGSDRVGWWQDWADGTGRAAKHNGGLMLDSQRQNKDGYGDSYGTTRATLRDHPRRYGRWEVRLRMKSTQTAHRDLEALIELVPDRPADEHCGAQNITIAEASPHTQGVRIGVRTLDGREWTRTEPGVSVNGSSHAVAVEVTPRHISWFLEGRLIGTVGNRGAIPDVPMTLRVSLQGEGPTQKMNRTQAIFDWMRGYSLERGQKVSGGPRLRRGTHAVGC